MLIHSSGERFCLTSCGATSTVITHDHKQVDCPACVAILNGINGQHCIASSANNRVTINVKSSPYFIEHGAD